MLEQNDDVASDNLNSRLEHSLSTAEDLEIRECAIHAGSREAFKLTTREPAEKAGTRGGPVRPSQPRDRGCGPAAKGLKGFATLRKGEG